MIVSGMEVSCNSIAYTCRHPGPGNENTVYSLSLFKDLKTEAGSRSAFKMTQALTSTLTRTHLETGKVTPLRLHCGVRPRLCEGVSARVRVCARRALTFVFNNSGTRRKAMR